MSFAPENEFLAKPESLLRVPVGLASPLWGLFAGAAMTGATWWWMTRWARPENLEAMFAAATALEAKVEPEAAAFAAPVAKAAEAVGASVVEAAPQPLAKALLEASEVAEPVGGEAAPVSPVLEVLAAEPTEPVEAAEPVVVAGGAADIAFEPALDARPKKKTQPPKLD